MAEGTAVNGTVDAKIVDSAKAELKDAIEEGTVDDKVKFDVTEEEMATIRAELACEFPDDYRYLSDAYIRSVASKPYSKDTSIRRPLEYTMEKLTAVMEWRMQVGAHLMEDMLKLAMEPDTSSAAVKDPTRYAKAKALATGLNTGSMYWHGLDKSGRPVLWVRTDRMVSNLATPSFHIFHAL